MLLSMEYCLDYIEKGGQELLLDHLFFEKQLVLVIYRLAWVSAAGQCLGHSPRHC